MIYIFDLDITLWDTFDKCNNTIWAKQLIPPYEIEGDIVTDDVKSICILRKGVREYLNHLYDEGHQLNFISAGSYYGLPFENQPSYNLLKLFDIEKYFTNKVLEYKTYDKTDSIKNIKEKIVFYDDSDKVLNSLKQYKNIIAVDSTEIKNWSKLIGKKYD